MGKVHVRYECPECGHVWDDDIEEGSLEDKMATVRCPQRTREHDGEPAMGRRILRSPIHAG